MMAIAFVKHVHMRTQDLLLQHFFYNIQNFIQKHKNTLYKNTVFLMNFRRMGMFLYNVKQHFPTMFCLIRIPMMFTHTNTILFPHKHKIYADF